jgi:hypothetical protein
MTAQGEPLLKRGVPVEGPLTGVGVRNGCEGQLEGVVRKRVQDFHAE